MEFKQPNRSRKGPPPSSQSPRRSTSVAQARTPAATPASELHPHTAATPRTTVFSTQQFSSIITTLRPRLRTKKALILLGGTTLLLIGGVGAALLIRSPDRSSDTARTSSLTTSTETPTYPTISPNGKAVDELGGWQRISPPNGEPVYAFVDSVDGVSISVSQQPLPANFQNDIENQVADLAKKFNATDKLTAGATKFYVGTSAKGPQSVILAKNDLLILIKSQKKIDNAAWVRYVKSLK